jgi:hypothetical protein
MARPPRPLTGYEVGYDATLTGVEPVDPDAIDWSEPGVPLTLTVGQPVGFIFRSPKGEIVSSVPSGRKGGAGFAFSAGGEIVPPMWPPADSSLALAIDQASGCWCYYDTALGDAQWHAPPGSTPIDHRPLEPVMRSTTAPPLDPRASFKRPDEDGKWMPICEDVAERTLFFHKETGATREAPWICLRTSTGGVIYFANLVTRQTRWTAPPLWMSGWVSRSPDATYSPADARSVGGARLSVESPPPAGSIVDAYDRRSPYARFLRPQMEARRMGEGGAPVYLCAPNNYPQYAREASDTPETYPPMSDADLSTLVDVVMGIAPSLVPMINGCGGFSDGAHGSWSSLCRAVASGTGDAPSSIAASLARLAAVGESCRTLIEQCVPNALVRIGAPMDEYGRRV